MSERTYKCYSCKEQFPKSQLTSYATLRSKTAYNYCPECLKEKRARELFSEKVCAIFGLKAPGQRIWTERKRLIENYGYTDNTIIECLDYIYKVEHKKKLAESLCLVNPISVNKMKHWKNSEQQKACAVIAASKTQIQEHIVPIKENTTSNKTNWNPDEWLED
jgi:DNA-directed RNA polymerase subunit RPC12/RpoP